MANGRAHVIAAFAILSSTCCMAQLTVQQQRTPETPPARDLSAPMLMSGGAKCSNSFYPAVKIRLENTETDVNVTVGTDGVPKNVAVVQSSGHPELDEAAVNCIATSWHFKPAIKDGQPVEATKKYAIKWQLRAPTPPTPAPNPQ